MQNLFTTVMGNRFVWILFVTFYLLTAPTNNYAGTLTDKITPVPYNANKGVLVPKSAIDAAWKEDPGFGDSSWRLCTGWPGGVGYEKGSGYESKISLDVGEDMYEDGSNPNTSCYIRIKFVINGSELLQLKSLTLTMIYDDGYIAYLNGAKVSEANAPASPQWNSSAPEAIEYSQPAVIDITRHLDKLVAGENLLAIHGLNESPSSSDFLINAKLEASTQYESGFTSSNLPIIIIDTHGRPIVDDPRIQADMGIIYNGKGQRNYITDPWNHYDGKIGIELRGSTSQNFPKKPYRIETQDSLGANLNVSLFGMPKENDWVLHNPYSDKSLIRNVLAYKISNDIGRYASRTQLCEVIVNGAYQGVYVFMEKIKRDKNRVDIARLDEDDVAGDSLTGGYIIKIDKPAGEQYDGWEGENVFYQFHYPKPNDIKPQQKSYIQNLVQRFEHIMQTNAFDNPDIGYPHYIDMESLVDHFIINELTRNIDAYRLSAYMYKDRDSKGGKFILGPVWDFNLSFGNGDYYNGWKTDGWNLDHLIDHTGKDFSPPFWWEKIRETDEFKSTLYTRWTSLRQGNLQTDLLISYIDNVADTLSEAQIRNFSKWPVLGVELWPNWFVGDTYEEEINWMKDWLVNRLAWMDAAIENYKTVTVKEVERTSTPTDFYVEQNWPNPFNSSTTISYTLPASAFVTATIYNLKGQQIQTIVHEQQQRGSHKVIWHGIDKGGRTMPSGAYIFHVKAVAKDKTDYTSKKMLLLQ